MIYNNNLEIIVKWMKINKFVWIVNNFFNILMNLIKKYIKYITLNQI